MPFSGTRTLIMGFWTSILTALGLVKRPAKLIVVGLDNSGKTTILRSIRPDTQSFDVVPTVGFQEETFDLGNLRFTAFDMSGAETYRSLWEKFYADVNGIIFVADAADSIRMCVARDELDTLLAHPDLKKGKAGQNKCPILVFANKMDLPSAMDPAEASVILGLTALTDRAWHIQGSNALTGEGVEAGMKWLAQQLNARAQAAAPAPAPAPPAGKGSAAAGAKGGSGAGASA